VSSCVAHFRSQRFVERNEKKTAKELRVLEAQKKRWVSE